MYENEPKFCSMCKALGHTIEVCKKNGTTGQGRVIAGPSSIRATPKDKDLEVSHPIGSTKDTVKDPPCDSECCLQFCGGC